MTSLGPRNTRSRIYRYICIYAEWFFSVLTLIGHSVGDKPPPKVFSTKKSISPSRAGMPARDEGVALPGTNDDGGLI